jgi:hypothetical protein
MSDKPVINPLLNVRPYHIDYDEIRRTAKSLDEATVLLTPDLKEFLNKWKMVQRNNKLVTARNIGIAPAIKPNKEA